MKLAHLLVVFPAVALLSIAALRTEARQGEPTIQNLGWMAGHWHVETNGTLTEEVWLAPAGGLLLGMGRTAPKAGRASFEFLRIEQRKGGPVYVASPGGGATTDFPLADIGEHFVLFENPEHDFPQRIRYELTPEGGLHARVSGTVNSKEESEEWTWRMR